MRKVVRLAQLADQTPVYISVCYMPRPPHPFFFLFYHPNNIWWGVKTTKFLEESQETCKCCVGKNPKFIRSYIMWLIFSSVPLITFWCVCVWHSAFLLSFSWARQLSRGIPADVGVKSVVLGAVIEEGRSTMSPSRFATGWADRFFFNTCRLRSALGWMKPVAYPGILFGAGRFKKFSWGQRTERTGIWGR